jgi:hypothetical protein
MKILIEISPAEYDRLVSRVPEASPVYSTLKNGSKLDCSGPGLESATMAILCDPNQAMAILQAAKKLCPEVACAMAKGIKLVRRA